MHKLLIAGALALCVSLFSINTQCASSFTSKRVLTAVLGTGLTSAGVTAAVHWYNTKYAKAPLSKKIVATVTALGVATGFVIYFWNHDGGTGSDDEND